MKTIALLTLSLTLCSCTTGRLDQSEGTMSFTVIGGSSDKFAASPSGFVIDGMTHIGKPKTKPTPKP